MAKALSSESPALQSAAPGAAWAELCGIEDDDEVELHPGYASLSGLAGRKRDKKPVIILDPEVAEKAAQVMEINAGQLIVRPDRSLQGFARLGLDSWDDGEDEVSEQFAQEDVLEEEDEDQEAALAEWINPTESPPDEDAAEPSAADHEFEYVAEAEPEPADAEEAMALGMETPEDFAGPEVPSAEDTDVYELSIEFSERSDDVPAVDEPPIEDAVNEETVVAEAWLEWARSAPEVPLAEEAPFTAADEFCGPSESEALAHTVEDIAPAGPALPKHELRVMIAQLGRPHLPLERRIWDRLRRFYALVRRVLS